MNIKKGTLELLFVILRETKLSLSEARVRDAFMKEVMESIKLFQEERKKVIETFCTKDDKGAPLIENNNYSFSAENFPQAQTELNTLIMEDIELKITPAIKAIVEKTEYLPKVGEAEIIDAILK